MASIDVYTAINKKLIVYSKVLPPLIAFVYFIAPLGGSWSTTQHGIAILNVAIVFSSGPTRSYIRETHWTVCVYLYHVGRS